MILEDIVLSIIGLGFAFLLFASTTMFCWSMYEDIQFKKEERVIKKLELCEKRDNDNLSRALLGINNLHFRNDEEY